MKLHDLKTPAGKQAFRRILDAHRQDILNWMLRHSRELLAWLELAEQSQTPGGNAFVDLVYTTDEDSPDPERVERARAFCAALKYGFKTLSLYRKEWNAKADYYHAWQEYAKKNKMGMEQAMDTILLTCLLDAIAIENLLERQVEDIADMTYLHQILSERVRHFLLEHGRRRSIETDSEESPETDGEPSADIPDMQESAADAVAYRELIDLLERILSQRQLKILFMDSDGLKAPEIAENLGMTEDAVRQELHRAREKVRKKITS